MSEHFSTNSTRREACLRKNKIVSAETKNASRCMATLVDGNKVKSVRTNFHLKDANRPQEQSKSSQLLNKCNATKRKKEFAPAQYKLNMLAHERCYCGQKGNCEICLLTPEARKKLMKYDEPLLLSNHIPIKKPVKSKCTKICYCRKKGSCELCALP